MAIKDSEERNTVVEVRVRDMRVLHCPTPALHAHSHVSHLIKLLDYGVSNFIFSKEQELVRYFSNLRT